MSHDRDALNPEQAERLNRKIERMISGQPAPVLDGDTEDLAEIARLLNASLPDDTPDPGFREQLKKDLLDPGPRLVPFRPRQRSRRLPLAAAGAAALTVIATTVAAMLLLGGDDGASPNALLAVATPTTSVGGSALYAAASITAEQTATVEAQSPPAAARVTNQAPQAPTVAPEAATAVPTEKVEASQGESSEPTRIRTVIDLPPIDRQHIELGALATVASEVSEPPDIAYSLGAELSALETSALAYRFSTPYVDAKLILRSASEFLGIEPPADIQDRQGRKIYSLSSPETGASFTWTPESGAFACTLPQATSTAEVADLSALAIEWLQEFGYPVDDGAQPIIETRDTGEQLIHVPLGDRLPDPALGHPMRITLVVDPAGRIVRVSGYWLEVTSEEEVPLLTTEQAWDSLNSGAGYWPDGMAPRSPGEFVISKFSVRYMLTVEDHSNNLVLQPVIAANGTFNPSDGSPSYQATVYLQGAAQV